MNDYMPKRGPDPQLNDERLTEVVELAMNENDRPFATAPDVAEYVDMGRRGVSKRLREISENGVLERAEIGGSAVIYWSKESL